jgi:hypothetical protein
VIFKPWPTPTQMRKQWFLLMMYGPACITAGKVGGWLLLAGAFTCIVAVGQYLHVLYHDHFIERERANPSADDGDRYGYARTYTIDEAQRIGRGSIAARIADDTLRRLTEQGLDCVGGGYYDVSQKIHTAALHAARDAIEG